MLCAFDFSRMVKTIRYNMARISETITCEGEDGITTENTNRSEQDQMRK